jgi:hypothetical protein
MSLILIIIQLKSLITRQVNYFYFNNYFKNSFYLKQSNYQNHRFASKVLLKRKRIQKSIILELVNKNRFK